MVKNPLSSSIVLLLGKPLPKHYHRKNAVFQELYFYIHTFKGRENCLISLYVENENYMRFTKSLEAVLRMGSIAQEEYGTAPTCNYRDDDLSNISQKQNRDDPN